MDLQRRGRESRKAGDTSRAFRRAKAYKRDERGGERW